MKEELPQPYSLELRRSPEESTVLGLNPEQLIALAFLAQKHGLDNSTWWALLRHNVLKLYPDIDMHLLPSHEEGSIEALAVTALQQIKRGSTRGLKR